MVKIKNTEGTQLSVQEIEVNKDIVYKRTNIRRISKIDENTRETKKYWLYDEEQYTHQEWLQKLTDEVFSMKKKLV